jgi:lipopolysaccharide/colanic/teichoic acid biosynthesis glycosyltransferase
MSIVGPRPQIESLTSHYTEEERQILTVPPGLTDYASIRFINLGELLGDENVDEKYMREIEPEKTRLRLRYVREGNFAVDLKIIAWTALRMLGISRLSGKRLLKRHADEQ